MATRDEAILKALIHVDRHMSAAEVNLEHNLFGAGYSFGAIASVVESNRAMYTEQRPQIRVQMQRLFDLVSPGAVCTPAAHYALCIGMIEDALTLTDRAWRLIDVSPDVLDSGEQLSQEQLAEIRAQREHIDGYVADQRACLTELTAEISRMAAHLVAAAVGH